MTQKSKNNRRNGKNNSNDAIRIAAIVILVLAVVAIVVLMITTNLKKSDEEVVLPGRQSTEVVQSGQQTSKSYDKAPDMLIDVNKKYSATFKMAKGGEFVVELYPDKAPITVNSFVFLAREKFFDGVTFHRVLDGFMAQGGDPTGTGGGGPGYKFVNEDSDLTFDKPGVLAMANAGRDTNGSQFFITFSPTPQLNGGYTIFGQVTSGMDVVNGITRRDPQQFPDFTGDVIESVTITEE